MINFDPSIGSIQSIGSQMPKVGGAGNGGEHFGKAVKAVGKYVSEVDQQQQSVDTSIKDLLAGKSEDVVSVVSEVAKADMSFKLLVGVRNKLVEAYKQTMNMQV